MSSPSPRSVGRSSRAESNQHTVATAEEKTASGWIPYTHPHGWTYSRHPEKKIVTELDVRLLQQYTFDLTGDLEVWILDKNKKHREFVFVNHTLRYASQDKQRVIHWQKSIDDHDLRINYWSFMCRYPSHRQLPLGALSAARQILNCYVIDGLRQRSESQAPLTLEQSKELLEYLDTPLAQQVEAPLQAKAQSRPSVEAHPQAQAELQADGCPPTFDIPSQSDAMTALVSWIFMISARHRRLHKYGNHTKHGNPDRSQEYGTWSRTWFHTVSTTLCFGGPRNHLHRIRVALRTMELQRRVDTWAEYLETVARELEICTLAATVLLSSSIGLLAVPGMDNNARIMTLLSIAFTLGSIMTGIYLQWQTGKIKFDDKEMRSPSRAPILAVFFSIPFASLTWAMILFTVAIILYSIFGYNSVSDGSNVRFGHPTSISVLVSTAVFVVLMSLTVLFFRRIRLRHHLLEGSEDELV